MPHPAPVRPPPAPTRALGLEWLPATAAPHPTDCSTRSARPRPLVVILPWMWAARAAVTRHAALYHSLGCDVAIFYGWSPLSVWLPLLARRNAALLLAGLAAHLRNHPRDVLLACFSGAAKGVLCPLLDLLLPGVAAAAAASDTAAAAAASRFPPSPATAKPSQPADAPPFPTSSTAATATAAAVGAVSAAGPLRHLLALLPGQLAERIGWPAKSPPQADGSQAPHQALQPSPQAPPQRPQPQDPAAALLFSHLRGILFDSGPVDFDSSVGVRLFATARDPTLRSLQAAAGSVAAGTLDFCLYEAFESQRRAMWVGLHADLAAARLPVLFMYSWRGDALADPQPIHALAVALRSAAAAAVVEVPAVSPVTEPDPAATIPAAAPAAAKGGANSGTGTRGLCSSSGGTDDPGRACLGDRGHSKAGEAVATARTGGGRPTSGRNAGNNSGSIRDISNSSNSSSSSSSHDGDEQAVMRHAGSHPSGHDCRDCTAITSATPRLGCTATAINSTWGAVGQRSALPSVAPSPVQAPTLQHPASPGRCCAHGAGAGQVRVRVWEQGWDSSAHVAHLRQHPEQYQRVVEAFLDNCLSSRP